MTTPGKQTTKRILIAEDERPMAKALQIKLKSQGYEVDVAMNGQEALDMLQSAKPPYDLLILDLIMPVLNGFAVLDTIEQNKIKVEVIVASNLSQADDLEKAKEKGSIDYFIKSNSSLQEIVARVVSHLET